jgi:nitrogen fixation/metabolism regulation signal transduction histidine kinase
LAPDLPLIQGDPTQLRQVIHNLLANARDALSEVSEGGLIEVSTQLTEAGSHEGASQSAVRFTVMDNGSGFTAQVLQRAFEPYVTTKAQVKCTSGLKVITER